MVFTFTFTLYDTGLPTKDETSERTVLNLCCFCISIQFYATVSLFLSLPNHGKTKYLKQSLKSHPFWVTLYMFKTEKQLGSPTQVYLICTQLRALQTPQFQNSCAQFRATEFRLETLISLSQI